MKLQEWVNIRELEELIEEGLVSDRKHHSLPLKILNYTPKASGIKEWSQTLSRCRGLVYEEGTNELYAISFSKFWNHGDSVHIKSLPTGMPRIFEKADGSYLNLFFYKGLPVVSTRGSFESDQAKWAQKWVNDHILLDKTNIATDRYNYIFEVIIPEDKKVVNYNWSGLIFLGFTRLFDGAEFPPELHLQWLQGHRVVKEYTYDDLEKLQAEDIPNEEGRVAVWYNDNAPSFRVKLKFETYKLLHRMYFQTTAEVIWELTKNKEDVEEKLIGGDPKLVEWATDIRANILRNRDDLEGISKQQFRYAVEMTNIAVDLEAPEKERRKAFAMYAVKSENASLLFLLYDAKFGLYEEQLWKICKPVNSRFRDEGEDG